MKIPIVALGAINILLGSLLIGRGMGAGIPFMIGMPGQSGIAVGIHLLVFFGVQVIAHRNRIDRLLAEKDRWLYLMPLPTAAFVVGGLLEGSRYHG